MRPLALRLHPRRRERRNAFLALRILHHEPVRGLRQRHDVVALSEKTQPAAVQELEHLAIIGQVVGVEKRRARDGYQLGIEDAVPDPVGTSVTLVAVIGSQHAFENRLESRFGELVHGRFVSGGPVAHGRWGAVR